MGSRPFFLFALRLLFFDLLVELVEGLVKGLLHLLLYVRGVQSRKRIIRIDLHLGVLILDLVRGCRHRFLHAAEDQVSADSAGENQTDRDCQHQPDDQAIPLVFVASGRGDPAWEEDGRQAWTTRAWRRKCRRGSRPRAGAPAFPRAAGATTGGFPLAAGRGIGGTAGAVGGAAFGP